MQIKYKVPYGIYTEYFQNYSGLNIRGILQINRFFNYLGQKSPALSVVVFGILFLLVLFLFECVVWLSLVLIFLVINKITGLNFPIIGLFTIGIREIAISTSIFVVLVLILIIFWRIINFEMPLLLKEMINDRRLIQSNQGKNKPPLERSRFAILSLYKKGEELVQAYKFIPGLTKASSLSDAKKGMKKILINNIPIIANDCYVPWNFKITKYKGKIDKKRKCQIESMLNTIWDIYLDSEYTEIKFRRNQYKKLQSKEHRKHLKVRRL